MVGGGTVIVDCQAVTMLDALLLIIGDACDEKECASVTKPRGAFWANGSPYHSACKAEI